MTRRIRPEEQKLWQAVTHTFYPTPLRLPPTPAAPSKPAAEAAKPADKPKPYAPPERIEPNRQQRISRDREPIEGRLDLHGLDQERAKATLERFLLRAYDDGVRAVLVITGKGVLGDGILRRRAPEWLSAPTLRHVVAGISEAHRKHGGEGALYVALKRKPRA